MYFMLLSKASWLHLGGCALASPHSIYAALSYYY
jgi:hypothetical protein